jgi:hypothetical protein
MDDTDPELKELVRARLMQLSCEERFIRGALMFDAAREMVLASLPRGLSEVELKKTLYERIYGRALEADIERSSAARAGAAPLPHKR